MPKITSEKITPTRAKFTVAVAQKELDPFLDTAYKNIAKQVQIPGFRKGNAPKQLIDARFGKEAVIQEAVNASLDDFYRKALEESGEIPMGRPSADVEKWPDLTKPRSELKLVFEVEVRPEFSLPDYSGYKLTVDEVKVDDDAVEAELTKLRGRFGKLNDVERPAAKGDFVEINLIAKIDDKEVDRAEGVSYEFGSGNMLDGLDDALETLTAGEETTFNAPLLGGEYEGQDAEISVTLTSVKERELAEADDDFAQMASEFETLAELREGLKKQVAQQAEFQMGQQARDLLLEKLIADAAIPVSDVLLTEEVENHLEQAGREGDSEYEAEAKAEIAKQIQMQLLMDAIIEAEKVEPTQQEFSQYIMQSAQQYGIEPGQFIQMLSQGNQMQAVLGEVARNKALATVLSKVKVVDNNGKAVDLSTYTAVDNGEDAEEKKSASKKAPAKKTAAKTTDKAETKKAPAKKPAAKKAPAKKDADK